MEQKDRIRELLKKEYGIKTDEQLLKAIEAQKGTQIGIFVSPCKARKTA